MSAELPWEKARVLMRVTGRVFDSDSMEFLRERLEFLVLLMSSSLRSSKLLVSEELTMELLP